jgi:hypothetical protein
MKILILLFCATAAWGQTDGLFSEIDQIVTELSRITGLKPLKKVPHSTIDRAGLKTFLEQQLKEHVKPEELRSEEVTLKKFGLVPQDFDLKKTTVDLLTEQAAALYDFRKKRLFVLEGNSTALQKIALVHELAHALADQHFHLEKFIEQGVKSDDGSTARAAVMEGQATWLMSEYMAAQMGQSLKNAPGMVEMMSRATESGGDQFPVLAKAPLYIRESLSFPYTKGMLFQHKIFEKLDQQGFSEVFKRPPQSTQQILHPEKYFAAVIPSKPELPRPADERQYREYADGSVGELDHSILIRQYGTSDEAARIAPRWRGGSYRILEHKKSKRLVLAYAVDWEDEATASEYFRIYRKVLAGKWKNMEAKESGERMLAGRGDDGFFQVRLDGTRMSSLEGLEEPPR